jgi:hypothetical protein
MEQIRRGEYRIIRTNGTETLIEEKPTLDAVRRAIGADGIDTVCLDKRTRTQIMVVDDTGMVDGKPVNSKATELYHSICKPGTVWAIHGDVALCNDLDFA